MPEERTDTTRNLLGCSSVGVFPVGFGASTIGRPGMGLESVHNIDAAVSSALASGITFFDLAESYGGTFGQSEALFGKVIDRRRADMVIGTKFGGAQVGKEGPKHGFGRPTQVTRSLEGSLRRLGTDWIDLYQIHFPDPATDVSETIGALQDLVRAGKIRAWGISNVGSAGMGRWLDLAGDDRDFATATAEYNLLWREPERDLLPTLRSSGKTFIPYFPLQNGLLTGKYDYDPATGRLRGRGKVSEVKKHLIENAPWESLRNFASLSRDLGYKPSQVALAWLLHQPCVDLVIPGATNGPQLHENARAAHIKLTAEELETISRLFQKGISGRPGKIT